MVIKQFLLASFLSTTVLLPPSWFTVSTLDPDTLKKVEQSVVRLTYPIHTINPWTGQPQDFTATCTGFVIGNADGEDADFSTILTAAHCIPSDPDGPDGVEVAPILVVDTYWPGRVLKVDDVNDLALVEAQFTKAPLKLRTGVVVRGMDAYSFGYGYALNTYLFLQHIIAAPYAEIAEDYPIGILVSPGFIGGMSGGPVVDKNGRYFSVVQASTEHVGYGPTLANLKAFLGAYAN